MRRVAGIAELRMGLLVSGILAVAPNPARAATAAADLPDTVVAQLADGARVEHITVADLRAAAQRRGLAESDLSPAKVRELLGTQLDRRALRLATEAEPLAWTPEDSAQHRGVGLQFAFAAALDSAYTVERARRAALGDTVTHPAVLGAAMRDLELARHAPVWDDAVVARLAEAFAALPAPSAQDDLVQRARKMSRFPAVAAADSDAVIATHAEARSGFATCWGNGGSCARSTGRTWRMSGRSGTSSVRPCTSGCCGRRRDRRTHRPGLPTRVCCATRPRDSPPRPGPCGMCSRRCRATR